jgi:hypothetical protein
MIRPFTIALLGAAAFATSASARPCRPGETPRALAEGRRTCDPAERLKPYDPHAARTGTRAGFIDLGGGTEVRVGGRVQMDYDVRRR